MMQRGLRSALSPSALLLSVEGCSTSPLSLSSSSTTSSVALTQRRHMGTPYYRWQVGMMPHGDGTGFGLPWTKHNKLSDLKNMKFDTLSRKQWDYKGIDERLTAASEFGKLDDRPGFNGPRIVPHDELHSTEVNVDGYKKLWEHFDEYTKPGSNPKIQAAFAVKEYWDASEHYYVGGVWRRNRPSFRSVPQELLNRDTDYTAQEYAINWPKHMSRFRDRKYNPKWPPPGYKVPKFETKREFVFGCEEYGLVAEVERYYWYKSWGDINTRVGIYDVFGICLIFYHMYNVGRYNPSTLLWKQTTANMWYPGRKFLRSKGEPRDPNVELFWWQIPLDEFPNKGDVWYIRETRFGYINYLKRRDAKRAAEAALAH